MFSRTQKNKNYCGHISTNVKNHKNHHRPISANGKMQKYTQDINNININGSFQIYGWNWSCG